MNGKKNRRGGCRQYGSTLIFMIFFFTTRESYAIFNVVIKTMFDDLQKREICHEQFSGWLGGFHEL